MRIRKHVTTNSYKIPPEELPEGTPVSLPVELGGILLFHVLACHVSLPHASDRVRWSIDLRYQDPAQPSGHLYLKGFLVQSEAHPENVLNYPQWVSMWEKQLVHDKPWPPNSEMAWGSLQMQWCRDWGSITPAYQPQVQQRLQ